MPDLDAARERIKELELKLEEASRKLQERDDKQKQMYLQMYSQGQEAARLEHEKQVRQNNIRQDESNQIHFYFF